jgi:hypothetical protein
MDPFNIPWKFLDTFDSPNSVAHGTNTAAIVKPQPPKTFAQALTNICDIPLSQIPQPVVKGDRLAIEIPELYYEAGLEACKHNLHGRIIWPKGSTPLSVAALKVKLASIWKDLSKWGVISLGKGFFEFTFSSLEDVRRVRSVSSWNLNPGLLKLFAWTKDFNPRNQHHTSVQVWVRIYGLSQEYWHKNILFTIAGSIGTPICIDSVTAKPMHERTFGQFARVLVDVDLLQPLRYKLLVERKGFAFFVDLEYEHIPEFCLECKIIGHSVENCKRKYKTEEVMKNKEHQPKKKSNPGTKQVYVAIQDGDKQITNTIEGNHVEKEVINVEDEGNNIIQEAVAANGNARIPSPVQASPTLQVEDNNTMAILTPLSPRSIFKEQDQQLQLQLNQFDEEFSSQGSFVDATQIVENIHPPDRVPVGVTNPSSVEVNNPRPNANVLKDMNFLKESWANLAEAEENLVEANTASIQVVDDDNGFQVQLSKAQKKNQRKLTHASKDTYATRSKVPSKPFK